jgi:hypothetical protein
LTPNLAVRGARLFHIPAGDRIIQSEEHDRAYASNKKKFEQLYRQTGAPEFAAPEAPFGGGEFSNAFSGVDPKLWPQPFTPNGEFPMFQWIFVCFK